MDMSHPHPRRRYLFNVHPILTSSQLRSTHVATTPSEVKQSFRKSATFHSPTTPPSREHDPIMNIPLLPRRSPTCPKDLEDVIAAGDDRLAHILGAVDRSLSGLESFSSGSDRTLAGEDLPVPRFVLNAHIDDHPDLMDIDEDETHSRPPSCHRHKAKKHHASDSGIGSTVSSSESSMLGVQAGMKTALLCDGAGNSASSLSSFNIEGIVQTGINGLAVSNIVTATGSQHSLSEYACRQIQKFIILPILREDKLNDFHPLVTGIPYRIARKEITCLRDLEKVLLWLAPKWSASKASFFNFCTTSIQCIHTTVEYLNENDQRRPTDRPYTNGYFLDLVEQVRQYAATLAASRSRMASSEKHLEESDKGSDETLSLIGGLSQTGRPAELVRRKDGQSISLRTGEVLAEQCSSADYRKGLKRSVSEELDENAVRSMARRRKSLQPVVKDVQKCRECDRMFKRPCDLTKHEKTHSRPWKCNDTTCKYHEYGWPTEKERDRHVNDKHSAAPSMYKCQYHPCPYESKRESNCKQHMEKAHGWHYIRSKNNGKNSKKMQNNNTPPTPQMSTPGSYIFDAATPELCNGLTMYEPLNAHSRPNSLNESFITSESTTPYLNNSLLGYNETFGPLSPGFSWHDSNNFGSGNPSGYTNTPHHAAWDSASASELPAALSSFEPSLTPQDEEPIFGTNFDWSNMDYTSLNLQLNTPATSVDTRPCDAFSRNSSISYKQRPKANVPSLSPGAQGDAMLYSPYSSNSNDISVDETFGEYAHDIQKPTHDFSLFGDTNATSSLSSLGNEGMFQELANFMPSTWSGHGTDLARQFGLDLMQIDHD